MNMIARCGLSVVGLALALVGGAAPILAEGTTAIEIVLTDKGFEPKEIKAGADTAIVLTVKNKTAAAAEFESKPLKIEKVVAANSQIIVRLKPQPKGRYLFVNEYKEDTVQGYLTVE